MRVHPITKLSSHSAKAIPSSVVKYAKGTTRHTIGMPPRLIRVLDSHPAMASLRRMFAARMPHELRKGSIPYTSRPKAQTLADTPFAPREQPREVIIFGDFGNDVEAVLALIKALQSPRIDVKGVVTAGINAERNADIVKRIFDCFGVQIPIGIGRTLPYGQEGDDILSNYRKTHQSHAGISYEGRELHLADYLDSSRLVQKIFDESCDGDIFAMNFSALTDLACLEDDTLKKFSGIYIMGQAFHLRSGKLAPDTEAGNIKRDLKAATRVTGISDEIPLLFVGKHAARAAPISPNRYARLQNTGTVLGDFIANHAKETVSRFVSEQPTAYQKAYGYDKNPASVSIDDLPAWNNPYHSFVVAAAEDPTILGVDVVDGVTFIGQDPKGIDSDLKGLLASVRDKILDDVLGYVSTRHSPTFRLLPPLKKLELPELDDDQIPVIIDTDILRDPDDFLALLYILGNPRLRLVGAIAESMIPYRRAKGLAAIFRLLNRHIAIAEGSSLPIRLKDSPFAQHENRLRQVNGRLVLAEGLTPIFLNPGELITEAAKKYGGRLKILAVSPSTSLAQVATDNLREFQDVAEIVFMGQAQKDSETDQWLPSTEAYNFSEDIDASIIVLSAAHMCGIRRVFVGKYAAYAVRDAGLMQASFFTGLSAAVSDHVIMKALEANAIDGLESFARRAPKIFGRVFNLPGSPNTSDCLDAIRKGKIRFSPYDLIAAAALDPQNFDDFFETRPQDVDPENNVVLIGNTSKHSGISKLNDLIQHCVECLLAAVA